MKLKIQSYEEARLEYFREQLAHAERVLDWWMQHSPDPEICAEKAEKVNFYSDILKILEEKQ